MLFGYARVSSKTQGDRHSWEYQKNALIEYGVPQKNIYYDVVSGKNFTDRTNFDEMRKYFREGDTLVIRELSRLGRDTSKSLLLIEELLEHGITIHSISEGITLDNSPMGKCFTTICLAFANLETDLRAERCRLGLQNAQKNGKKLGRPSLKETKGEMLEYALHLFQENEKSVREIAEITGVSHSAIYREVKARNIVRR